MLRSTHFAALMGLTLLGCAQPAGTRPHDMSAPEHLTKAGSEDTSARSHDKRYDASANETRSKCRSTAAEAIWYRAKLILPEQVLVQRVMVPRALGQKSRWSWSSLAEPL